MSVSEFLTSTEIDQFYNIDFLKNLIQYIHETIIPNLLSDSLHESLNDTEIYQFQHFYCHDISNIIFKLGRLFERNRTIGKYVMIDCENPWFKGDSMMIKNDRIDSPFIHTENKEIEIEILTICTKLIDFISNIYEHNIIMMNDSITSATLLQFFFDVVNIDELRELLSLYVNDYREIWEISKPIRSYYMSLFYHIQSVYSHDSKINEAYYSHIPECVFNVFTPSIWFINDDPDFIEFIQNVYYSDKSECTDIMIPMSYRYKYLLKYLGGTRTSLDEYDNENIINFHRHDLIVDDIIYLYSKFKVETSSTIFIDSLTLLKLLDISDENNTYQDLDSDKLTQLISIICVYLMEFYKVIKSKRANISNNIPFCNTLLNIIDKALSFVPDLLNSYLIYYVPNCISLIPANIINLTKLDTVNGIFNSIISNEYGKQYLSTIDCGELLKHLTLNVLEEIKFNNDDDVDDELMDGIMCQPIIVPFFFPHNNTICDKYMTESYLWNKPENPYTREPLTIEQLNEYNSKEDIMALIAEKEKLIKRR